MLKPALATAIALSAFVASPALADTKLRGVDIKPNDSPFAGAAQITVERKAGKLAVSDVTVLVNVRTGGYMKNTAKKYTIFVADVFVQNIWGKGAAYPLTPRNLQNGDGVRSIEGKKTLYFNKANLGPLAKQALDFCGGHNGAEAKSFSLSFPLTLTVKAGEEYYGGHRDIVTKEAYTEVAGYVTCPGKPQRTALPDKPASERMAIPPKVKSAKLAIVNGIGEACPKPVFLVATFETDRAGAFDIILRRNDGETARKTVTAEKKNGKFVARYERTYTFDRDVRRKYMVEVVDMPKASAWVPMTVNCDGLGSAAEGNGFAIQ